VASVIPALDLTHQGSKHRIWYFRPAHAHVTCGFFMVSRTTSWQVGRAWEVVLLRPQFHSCRCIAPSKRPPGGRQSARPLHHREGGRKEAGNGAASFCNAKRCVTNKPRDPGCHNQQTALAWITQNKTQPNDPGRHTNVGCLRVDHAYRLWAFFEDENSSMIGV
jgi:hypothetical protein